MLRYTRKQLDEWERRILDLLRLRGSLSASDIRQETRIPAAQVVKLLSALLDAGRIQMQTIETRYKSPWMRGEIPYTTRAYSIAEGRRRKR